MADYVKSFATDKYAEVCFYIENNNIFAIGEKMNKIDENAYMNGYNWEAFFNCYLAKKSPELLEGMNTDPEAGMYVAYYELSDENSARAKRFEELIVSLVENERELYDFLRENGGEIEWD
ncbi:MAG: immunity 51 family protein [Oscillospiraceae bacterium]|nr:immunity 51 family protein [Oscillospiraceae bacterium]